MDGGPFRSGRPVERRVANRPEQAYRQPEEPQPVVGEAPKPAHRSAPHHASKEEKRPLRRFKWIVIAAIVILLGVLGWLGWSSMSTGATGIDGGKYQAVFFTNGQVYFGKLKAFNSGYLKLTDIYYLQSQSGSDTSNNPQATSKDQAGSNVQLIKLGDEIHGPEDEMIISKDQVLFYENLKDNGKVVQSIKKFKNN